ncbi:MAG: Holliday junction branch migration protein RuvA [Candidatus Gastranaerophilaceae bacterium]
MYDYIKGQFAYKTSGTKGFFATVETCGIGYLCEIMERDFILLPENGEIKIYTVLIHREDKMSLCGFLKREDRDIFNILTSVSGVGSKMALTLLNSFKVTDLVGFVLEGDYKELTKAKSVGPKLAQKIILELKDKLTTYQDAAPVQNTNLSVKISSQNIEDAKTVLLSLGYLKDEVTQAITKAAEHLQDNATAEDVLKESLKILSI